MVNKELLKRYLKNQYSDEDWEVLKQYFSEKDLQVLKDTMQEDWETNAEELDKNIESAISQKMLKTIKGKINTRKPIVSTRRIWFRRISSAAAAILLLMGSFWYFSLSSTIPTNDKVTLASNYGEIKNIILPDSTAVVLNANSSLSYLEENPRKVWLKGEAFFDVRKKITTKERFLVITDDVQIEVLGTAFNVRNRYAATEVFLEEGKVNLELKESARNNISMTPGDVVNYSIEKKVLEEKKSVESVESYDWQQGIKLLKNSTGKEILAEMQAIYGVAFEVENTDILNLKYTIPIPLEDREMALIVLGKLLNVEVENTPIKNKLKLKKS